MYHANMVLNTIQSKKACSCPNMELSAFFKCQILTEWDVTVAMHDKAAHDALTAQPKISIAPFVIECHEVVVLLRVVDALGNLPYEIRCRHQFALK